MSRLPRVFAPELPCHVTIRGNDRQDIVFSDADRQRLLRDLTHEARRNGMPIHAYVLMTNHVHLLVTGMTPDAIARSIQGLGRRYVAYFNLRYERRGTLWEGRYKASVIACERYLLACHRYIDLNPVRAGLAAAPEDYPWSSHRHYATGVPDDLVTPHPIWNSLGESEVTRRAAYRKLFEAVPDSAETTAIRMASRQGTAIGDAESCAALERRLGLRITPRSRGRSKVAPDNAPTEGQSILGIVV